MQEQQKKKWGIGPIGEFIRKHGLDKKFLALGPEPVASIPYRGRLYRFYIPDAMSDKMQLSPLFGHGFHEQPLLEIFSRAVTGRGGAFIDLGANFGNHTVYFAAVLGADVVYSVEPQARMAAIIRRTAELNGLSNVHVIEAAAGAKPGFAEIREENAENSGMMSYRPSDETGVVPVVRCDDFIGDTIVRGIKIDVEGMQMPALRGLSRTIRRDLPPIWLELRPAKNEVDQPSEWLARLGYERRKISFRDYLFTVPSSMPSEK